MTAPDNRPIDPNAETAAGTAPADASSPLSAWLAGDNGRTSGGLDSATEASAMGLPPVVGKYRLIRCIGQGGMGSVFLAEQENPRRTVALKMIKPGYISRNLLKRFELEAQVLGRLQHPGIAQIFEAGTFDAGQGVQPYFAMEYVEGRPLSELVLERGRSINENLDLVARICDAVHHAHQKGVIHRDLKPGNILVINRAAGALAPGVQSVGVESQGAPKILDFGVARATDSDIQVTTMQTDVGQLVGTLPYMSPEQVAGDPNDLDIRSDVYALGVIAYELLTGRLPHDLSRKTVAIAARIISEEDPAPLSTMHKGLRGDVETIIAKALEKDKSRRYQSAAELAVDTRRYLSNEPILARPPSRAYQIRKFAQRNRALVGGLFAVFLVLVAGIAATSIGFARARDQRNAAELAGQRAQREADKTRAINSFLINDMLGSANPAVAQGQVITVEMVLNEAVKKVGTAFAGEPELEATIRSTLGETYGGLGRHEESFSQFSAAHDAMLVALGLDHEHTLGTIVNMSAALNNLGRPADAAGNLTEALPRMERLLGPDHRTTLTARQVLATSLSDQGKFAEAEPLLRAVMESQSRIFGDEHEDTQISISNYAYLLGELGRNVEAEPLYRRILEARRRSVGEMHPRTILATSNLAVTMVDLGRNKEAEGYLRQVYDSSVKVFGPDHPSTVDALANLATFTGNDGRGEEALALMKQASAARHRGQGDDHPDTIATDSELMALYRQLGRAREAIALGEKVLEASRRVNGLDHPETLYTLNAMGAAYFAAMDLPKAEATTREALADRERVLGPDHPDSIISRHNLGAILVKAGRLDEAEPILLASLDAKRKQFGDSHRETAKTISVLGDLREHQNRMDEAIDLYNQALEIRREILPETHPDLARSMTEVARALIVLGRKEQAQALSTECLELCWRVHGSDHNLTSEAVRTMMLYHEAMSQPEEAARYRDMLK